MCKLKVILLSVAAVLLLAQGAASQMSLRLKVYPDSVWMGQDCRLTLAVQRPRGQQVLMPDSSHLPIGIELFDYQYFNTVSNDSFSIDSVSMLVRCFALMDSFQVQLPVYTFQEGDTIKQMSNAIRVVVRRDSIDFNAPAIAQVETYAVPEQPNWRLALVIGLGVVLLIVLINALLGRPIQRSVRLLLLYRRQLIFKRQFERLTTQAFAQRSGKTMSNALSLWKQQLERLDNRPFSTFTTKEIGEQIPDENLQTSLQSIDRWVYGGQPEGQPQKITVTLRRYAELFYQRRRQKIKNA